VQTSTSLLSYLWILLLATIPILVLLGLTVSLSGGFEQEPTPIALPGGEAGIGFDDLNFSFYLHRVLVPAGHTGSLDLIDPQTRQVVRIPISASTGKFEGGHGEGITSVDEGNGFLFVTDRTALRLNVVDPRTRSLASAVRLASGPDYVRFIAESDEIWVTQPSAQRIEVFELQSNGTPKPSHAGFIAVPGGPESLIIDHLHALAFTHLWRGVTIAIRLKDHSIAARWRNGCQGSRGIALDKKRGFLFAACDEGSLNVMDLNTGKILDRASSGGGVDIIAYNSKLGHVYLPGGDSATMAIVGISAAGSATVLMTVKTAKGAHCATADDRDGIYVCDPSHGQLLLFKDALP